MPLPCYSVMGTVIRQGHTMTRTVTIWAAVIGLIVAMSYAGGCSIDEIVTVDVPPNTREHFRENLEKQVPAEVTLRDARILRSEGDRMLKRRLEQQAADHQASNDALDAEIADGTFIEVHFFFEVAQSGAIGGKKFHTGCYDCVYTINGINQRLCHFVGNIIRDI